METNITKEKSTKILLVDDEPNILIALEFLFENEGYTIQKAFNGLEAIEKAEAFRPNIIVLDVMMPGIDGFEVARRLLNNSLFSATKIIFLTAKGTPEDKLNGYGSGGEIYITKPFDNDSLVQIVNEIVEFEL